MVLVNRVESNNFLDTKELTTDKHKRTKIFSSPFDCVNLWFNFCEEEVMCFNNVRIRIFTFCLTFLLGLTVSNWFAANEIQPNEIKQIIVLFEPKEIKNNLAETQCKKYFDYKTYNDLTKEIAKSKAIFRHYKNSSRKGENYRQELKELDSQIRSLEKVIKGMGFLQRESKAIHNLLYIENCVEY